MHTIGIGLIRLQPYPSRPKERNLYQTSSFSGSLHGLQRVQSGKISTCPPVLISPENTSHVHYPRNSLDTPECYPTGVLCKCKYGPMRECICTLGRCPLWRAKKHGTEECGCEVDQRSKKESGNVKLNLESQTSLKQVLNFKPKRFQHMATKLSIPLFTKIPNAYSTFSQLESSISLLVSCLFFSTLGATGIGRGYKPSNANSEGNTIPCAKWPGHEFV